MRKFNYLVLSILLIVNLSPSVQAQPYLTVTWKGELGCNEVPIDSVQVSNLTKDWTTTVFYPENSIKLYHSVSVKEVDLANRQIRVIPNPFSQTAEVNFYVEKEGMVFINLCDIFGRTVASFSQNMECGMQQVLVNAGSSGYYFLSVETPTDRRVAKMLSMGDCLNQDFSKINKISKINLANPENLGKIVVQNKGLKHQKSDDDFPFDKGDNMQFVAYTTDECGKVYVYLPYSEQIVANENIVFHADEEPLDYFVLIAQGVLTGSEGISKQNLVIKNQSEWENLVTAMNSVTNLSDSFVETNIDFCRYQIIAVFDTVRPNGGWDIGVTNITENTVSIRITYTNLDTGDFSCAITQPCYIVKIPASDKPIVFVDKTIPTRYPISIPLTEYSLNAPCQWKNINEDSIIVINNSEELENYIVCNGGTYPTIDFSKNTLLLVKTPNIRCYCEYSFYCHICNITRGIVQFSPNEYELNIVRIVTENRLDTGGWSNMGAMIIPKFDCGAALTLNSRCVHEKDICEKDSTLLCTRWQLVGAYDGVTDMLIKVFYPTGEIGAELCYTLYFLTDSSLCGYTASNHFFWGYEADYTTRRFSFKRIVWSEKYVLPELPDGKLYWDIFYPQGRLHSFSSQNNELRLYYYDGFNHSNYLLYKPR